MGVYAKLVRGAIAVGAVALGLATPAMADKPFSWSGFYFGGHAGAAWGDADWTVFTPASPIPVAQSHDLSGFAGGLQAGFQQQMGSLVLGLEVEWTGFGQVRGHREPYGHPFFTGVGAETRADWLLTATGRIGYASNAMLLYAKGGYATGQVTRKTYTIATLETSSLSETMADGWTVGGGLEYRIAKGVTVGLEYSFVTLDLGEKIAVQKPGFTQVDHLGGDFDLHLVTARLNFQLN